MKIVVDTSIWINVYRDTSGALGRRLATAVGSQPLMMVPFVAIEVLQGCSDEKEWTAIAEKLSAFERIEVANELWSSAARIYFDLRRQGVTVRSTLDCCIAQSCLDHDCLLFHNDRDFEKIATIRPLKHRRLDLTQGSP